MKSLKELYRIGSGPSSSHTMGPENACIYIKEKEKNVNNYKVTLYGSLALTGKGHFTDSIIKRTLGNDITEVIFDYKETKNHPNTFIVECYKDNKKINEYEIVSIGGGEILINGSFEETDKDLYPFKSFKEICDYAVKENISLDEVVYRFDTKDIKEYLNEVYETMKESIKNGLNKEGTIPGGLNVKRKAHDIYNFSNPRVDLKTRLLSSYAYAVAEENASMGKIVTAPTCGSCGVIPSVLYYLEKDLGYKKEDIVKALAVAGLIGNTIKQNASISGAYLGCQAEVGSACSMAAGAISFLEKGSVEEIDTAAEIAMEHHLGLTCDPVDGLVQIPCIERNAVASLRAFDAAMMSKLPIYPEKITFDSVVNTMLETGKDISLEYKETSLKGLARSNIKK